MSVIYFLNSKVPASAVSDLIAADGSRVMVVSTGRILSLTGAGKLLKGRAENVEFFKFSRDGENIKSLASAEEITGRLMGCGFSGGGHLCAIGGGTICDIVSFTASIYKRGMRLTLVPTTLLAMIDAAVGGKTAVNAGGVKNALGTFYPAEKIIIVPAFLRTLPAREIENGLFEAFKYGLLFSGKLALEIASKRDRFGVYNKESVPFFEKIIKTCAAYKTDITGTDPFDKGVRKLLNLGHTVGHAVESVSGNKISHGAAVGAGLLVEAVIARELGILKKSDIVLKFIAGFLERSASFESVKKILAAPRAFEKMAPYIAHDKKNLGTTMDMPLLSGIARPVIARVNLEKDILPILAEMRKLLGPVLDTDH